MTPDEHLWLQIAKTAVIGPPSASVAGHSDSDLVNLFNTSSNADLIIAFGKDGYAYIYKLVHQALGPAGVAGAEPPEVEPAEPTKITLSGTLNATGNLT